MEHGFPPEVTWREIPFATVLLHLVLAVVALAALGGLFCSTRRLARSSDIWLWGVGIVVAPVSSALSFSLSHELTQESVTVFFIGYVLFVWLVCGIGMAISTQRLRKQRRSSPVSLVLGSLLLLGFFLHSLLPSVPMAREAARRSQCRNILKQIGLAIHAHEKQDGGFPTSNSGEPPVSWRVDLLVFLDAKPLMERYDRSASWDAAVNTAVARDPVSSGYFQCPSRGRGRKQVITRDKDGRYFTDYLMLTGADTVSANNQSMRRADITDGLSQTVFVTEASGQNVVWTEPRDFDVSRQPIGINLKGHGKTDSPGMTSSYHTGGGHMLMGDGSVRFLSEKINPRVLKSLTTIDAGDSVEDRP